MKTEIRVVKQGDYSWAYENMGERSGFTCDASMLLEELFKKELVPSDANVVASTEEMDDCTGKLLRVRSDGYFSHYQVIINGKRYHNISLCRRGLSLTLDRETPSEIYFKVGQ